MSRRCRAGLVYCLSAMQLLPDGVKQATWSAGGWLRLKLRWLGSRFVFEYCEQEVERCDRPTPRTARNSAQTDNCTLSHLTIKQVADDRYKEDGIFFRQHAHPQGHTAEERVRMLRSSLVPGTSSRAARKPSGCPTAPAAGSKWPAGDRLKRKQATTAAIRLPRESTRDLEQQEDTCRCTSIINTRRY